ncbi:MAG: ferritin [Flavobacteriales bacterium]
MLNKRVEAALNSQLVIEANSSHYYLSIASWAETKGLDGTSEFFYEQSDEERMHMLRLVKFINERGGQAIIPQVDMPPKDFGDIENVFNEFLKHELLVSAKVNEVVGVCHEEKDFPTMNFMQWYVSEQIEEEALVRAIIDKLNLIDGDKGGLYMFDRDLKMIKNPQITINNDL